jgi:hypothetical protein
MKRIIFSLALFSALMIAGNAAFAQSASLNSSATIVTPITGTALAPLAFGTINKGATASITATSSSAAQVGFSGDESDNITVTIPATVTISTTSGDEGGSMTVTLNRAAVRYSPLGNIPANGAQSVDASSGSVTVGLSMDNQGNAVNNDGIGQAYIWIGGSVTPAATQQRGSYSGTFTVSAAYSN